MRNLQADLDHRVFDAVMRKSVVAPDLKTESGLAKGGNETPADLPCPGGFLRHAMDACLFEKFMLHPLFWGTSPLVVLRS